MLTPPRVLRFVDAELPAGALDGLEQPAVLIELIVGVDGSVSEARVLEGLSPELDAAALAAIQQFLFEPARRNLEPMVARIRYAYGFRAPTTGGDSPELPPLGTMTGVIRTHDDTPVGGAAVLIVSADEAVVRRGTTDAQGNFAFEQLPPGIYDVRVTVSDNEPLAYQEAVAEGESTDLVYRLPAPPAPVEEEEFGAVAVVDAPPREITRRTIRGEQLRTIPGTAGDALRAVEILPGVARPPFGAGTLIVRGSAPRRQRGVLRGRLGAAALPLRRPEERHQLAPAREHRLLPRQLLLALRTPHRRYPGSQPARPGHRRLPRRVRVERPGRVGHRRGPHHGAVRDRGGRAPQPHRPRLRVDRARGRGGDGRARLLRLPALRDVASEPARPPALADLRLETTLRR
ncbi:MAG: carboxypeptidase regulatory-like domain-containing protein [Sandaracinaceae bacterium]|nr:carboxypeptidase regulatory-like domain-containing protein [Sandaracinaceae bacterium]